MVNRQCWGGLGGFEGLQNISRNFKIINGCKKLELELQRVRGFWMGPAESARLIGYPIHYKGYLKKTETR